MLVLSRKLDSVVHIGPDITVKVISLGRRRVKLGIEAPEETWIRRDELVQEQGLDRAENLGRGTPLISVQEHY